MQFKSSILIALVVVLAFLCITTTLATPIQLLSQQLDADTTIITPTSTSTTLATTTTTAMEVQQASPFTHVMINRIDGDWVGWVDSDEHDAKIKRPLFVYETPCILNFVTPITALPGDKAIINFIWCEEDDKSCEATTSVRVFEIEITGPSTNTTATFEIPHLSWSKYMSSHIQFQIAHTRGEFEDFVGLYKSRSVYESDFASKGAKTAIVIVVVFCSVLIAMALAVLGYFIFKKVKKSRRQRHFPNQAGGHNLWRRK